MKSPHDTTAFVPSPSTWAPDRLVEAFRVLLEKRHFSPEIYTP
jgi:hypothetical protein